jgi:hypothetical protein
MRSLRHHPRRTLRERRVIVECLAISARGVLSANEGVAPPSTLHSEKGAARTPHAHVRIQAGAPCHRKEFPPRSVDNRSILSKTKEHGP